MVLPKSIIFNFIRAIMPKESYQISIPGWRPSTKNRLPVYRQVYDYLRAAILRKQLAPGQRLPSSRLLAEDIGVSRNSVLLAYEQLTLEGYIQGKTGSGSFVSQNSLDIPRNFQEEPGKTTRRKNKRKHTSTAISFDYPLSEYIIRKEASKAQKVPFQNPQPALDYFPFKTWARCANKVFRTMEYFHLGYDDAHGYFPLRKAIASYLRTNRALNCEPEHIIIVNGTQQGLNLAARLLLKKGQSFWIEDPGYVNAKAAFENAGGRPCYIPVTKGGMDVDYAIRHHPGASLVFLTPSHQFPVGGTLPINKRLRLLDWAAKHNMWVIEDDYDSEFRYSPNPIPSLHGLDRSGRVIYIGTFSKVLFPGLRIGYVVLPNAQMASVFAQAKAFTDRQNSITDQFILNEFITEGYFFTHLRKMRVLYKKRQDFLLHAIHKYGGALLTAEKKNCGMHLTAMLDDATDDRKISDMLLNEGIVTMPLSAYSFKHKTKPGLLLGFSAFEEKELRDSTIKMVELIAAFKK